MPLELFPEELLVAPSCSEEGRTKPVRGNKDDNAYQSEKVKNEAFYLLMIMHIAQQHYCSVGGLNATSMSRKVACFDFGCHFCCS